MSNATIIDFLLGYFSSIVPTQILAYAYYENRRYILTWDFGFDYVSVFRYSPILFGVRNVIIMYTIDHLFEYYELPDTYRFLLAGIVVGITYSLIGRFYLDIPGKVLNMDDPIMFNVYTVFIWIAIYYILYMIRDRLLEKV